MLDQLTSLFDLSKEDQEKIDHIFSHLEEKYKHYHDPWGLNLATCKQALKKLLPIYKYYFKVRVFGVRNIEDRPFMVISNHTGQLPIDGVLITICFLWEAATPRILRGMIERFMVKLPFLGELTAQTGSILGDRKNCQYLIDHGESILVFPEGVKGVSKNTEDFYKLQQFTTGFFRQALQNDLDILPVATVGAEEMYPFVYHSKN
jgi:1-acyl-sn-glycerol-3-phosphate acyltransferase